MLSSLESLKLEIAYVPLRERGPYKSNFDTRFPLEVVNLTNANVRAKLGEELGS